MFVNIPSWMLNIRAWEPGNRKHRRAFLFNTSWYLAKKSFSRIFGSILEMQISWVRVNSLDIFFWKYVLKTYQHANVTNGSWRWRRHYWIIIGDFILQRVIGSLYLLTKKRCNNKTKWPRQVRELILYLNPDGRWHRSLAGWQTL